MIDRVSGEIKTFNKIFTYGIWASVGHNHNKNFTGYFRIRKKLTNEFLILKRYTEKERK